MARTSVKTYNKRARGKTIFFKPKHPEIAAHISIRSPREARASVKWLYAMAKKYPNKLPTYARSAQIAAARANAMLKRKGLSVEERIEMRYVRDIYAAAMDTLWYKYNKRR